MKITKTALAGVLIIEPRVFTDARGSFMETFRRQLYLEITGHEFVQDNVSVSQYGVLRGLHYQRQHPQGKLIQVLAGSIYDVVVDFNPASTTYGKYLSLDLSDENHKQLWIPPGYAHGFCITSASALVQYKCTDYYHADDEAGIAWDCPRLNINWPLTAPILSAKDQQYQGLTN